MAVTSTDGDFEGSVAWSQPAETGCLVGGGQPPAPAWPALTLGHQGGHAKLCDLQVCSLAHGLVLAGSGLDCGCVELSGTQQRVQSLPLSSVDSAGLEFGYLSLGRERVGSRWPLPLEQPPAETGGGLGPCPP